MTNPIDPMTTNLAVSGKSLIASSKMEFDMGVPTNASDRTPIVNLAATMPFDQAIPFSINVAAGEADKNLWEATADVLRARAVVIVCRYGGGGIKINPDTVTHLPFPLSAVDADNPGWFFYNNPSGGGLTTPAGDTGPGIQKVTVDTEVESRFDGFIFI